ncbi:hypothetical protein EKO04_006045 [Ascochyta lentis]|uniref:Uncharacterized protein n=1 Tax=Ascochyta lentis TaxID=205686 RepID=A0A8H7J3S7_9PLEO|nr:hypothetical protein EKO04_006045 [Ascochyta lentis]
MMNLRLIARRVPATRAFSTSRVCYSGKSSMTEVSDGGSKHDKVQEPQSSIKPEGEPNPKQNVDHVEAAKAKVKTQAELDAEFQLRMQEHSGDGGASGVEYEDGQPVSMKRGVKNNMFRYI